MDTKISWMNIASALATIFMAFALLLIAVHRYADLPSGKEVQQSDVSFTIYERCINNVMYYEAHETVVLAVDSNTLKFKNCR